MHAPFYKQGFNHSWHVYFNNRLKLSPLLILMYKNSIFTILAGSDNCRLGSEKIEMILPTIEDPKGLKLE